MKVIDIHNYGRLIGSGGTEMFGRFYGIYRAEVTRIEKEDGVNVYYVRADDILEKGLNSTLVRFSQITN
ncbi:MAG: hypothetical protein ABDI07_11700, partial [Candidatus Kryptonium sp.]